MKKSFIWVLLFLVFLSSCSKEEDFAFKKYYKSQKVWSWIIENTNFYLAEAKWIKELDLSLESSGKINYLWKKVWDSVFAWELIAWVDSDEQWVLLNSSKDIDIYIESLISNTSIYYDSRISVLEENLKKAKNSFSGDILETNDLISLNQNNISLAKKEIERQESLVSIEQVNIKELENIYNWKLNDLYKNWESSITQSLILFTDIINFTDELLWISELNRDKNDKFEDYLGVKNPDLIKESRDNFFYTSTFLEDYRSFYEEKFENNSPSNEDILKWLEDWEKIAQSIKELLKNTYDILDNSLENVYFSLETINSYKQSVLSFWNQVEQNLNFISWDYVLWLRGIRESLWDIDRNYKKDLSLAQEKLNISIKNLELANQSLKNIESESQINLNKLNTKTSISNIDISSINFEIESIKKEKEAKIKELEINKVENLWNQNKIKVDINNASLYSPISWIITKKYFEVWEVLSLNSPIYSIADDSFIKLEISLSDENVEDIKIWNSLIVQEGYKTYEAKVYNISKSKDNLTKKINLELHIENKDRLIKIGDNLKVFLWKNSDYWIVIPNKSIVSKYIKTWVFLKIDWKSIFKEIDILKENDDFSMVSWLSLWDEIIVEWQDNLYDWEELLD